MDVDLSRYDDLVHRIYDAALEPARWPCVVGSIGDECGASRGLLFTPLHGPSTGGFSFPHNISDAMMERWGSSSVSDDPIAQEAFARGLLSEGSVFIGTELVSRAVLLKSRLWSELWEPMDIGHVCSGVVFGGTDSQILPTAVSVYRSREALPFGPTQVEVMRRLMGHMSRSLGVMFHLRDSSLQAVSSQSALDRFSTGVVLLNRRGAVQFANRAAERLFVAGTHVLSKGHTDNKRLALAARLSHQEVEFQNVVQRALKPLVELEPDHFSSAVVLSDKQGKPGCVVHVAPLGNATALDAGGRSPRVIVFLYDLSAAASLPPGLLTELFGLTAAEARAALQILQGGPVEEISRRLGVSVNTLKSQLKAVYAKMQVSRHSDLLKLLLALAMP